MVVVCYSSSKVGKEYCIRLVRTLSLQTFTMVVSLEFIFFTFGINQPILIKTR